jgi:two-component system, chemotaxis family, chemotaxis protein CheY
MKMLVVDDSHFIRNRIVRALKVHKIGNVLTAADGLEAIEVFKKDKPELVTMDITMPNLDGVQCTKELVRLNPKVLILIISAVADKPTAINAMLSGANGFLLKPFTDDQLNDALNLLIKGARRG